MNEAQCDQHEADPLSRWRSLAVTLGFYGVALAAGVACAIYSEESGPRLYLILLVGGVIGALAEYFIWVAISVGVRSIRRHSPDSSTNDNTRNG